MNTVEIWIVTIHSHATGEPSWTRRFIGLPTRRNIQDVLDCEYENQRTGMQDIGIFIDLARRLPVNYATRAQTTDGLAVASAQVEIGSFHIRKEEAYTL